MRSRTPTTRSTESRATIRSTAGWRPLSAGRPASGTEPRPRRQEEGESLDQLLAEEEPDVYADDDGAEEDEQLGSIAGDPDAADEDLDGLLLDDGPDPRSGRLVADDEGAHADAEADLVARDVGIDGGAASAEEAAVHTVEDDDTDIRSDS